MHQREHDRRRDPGQRRHDPPRPQSNVNAVLALQRTIGNRSTTQVLARDSKDKNRPNYEHSAKFGKYGPIQITGGNIGDWAAKKTPDDLRVVSAKGKHSDELKRLFDSKAKLDTLVTTSIVGENTLVTITFKSCRIRRYSIEGDKEEWTVEFEGANRESVSIGAAR
jgi:hypothetical protein